MSSNIILADNGVSSGTAGIKESGGSDGTLLLQTTTSGGTATTALTIDTSQNVGVGVTPNTWSLGKVLQIGSTTELWNDGSSGTYLSSNTYYNGGFKFQASGYALSYTQSATFGTHIWNVSNASGTAGNAITFTQAMTLDNSGNLLVGNTSYASTPSSGVTIQTGNNASVNVGHTSSPSGYLFVNFGYGGTQIGSITQNGTTAVAYNTMSDYRLKENPVKITNGVETINKLNPVNFTWKPDGTFDSGFLAHEFQSVLPRSVVGEKDAVDAENKPIYQSMDNSGVVPFLVAAIQELSAKVTALEAKVGA